MRKLTLIASGTSLLVLALGMTNVPLPAASPITVALNEQWSTVPLPDTALGVFENQGKLWAVGASEMIAASDDGGRTWSVKRHQKPGEMLFFIAVSNNEMWAIGSGHDRLQSKDGGQTWKQIQGMKNSWFAGEFGRDKDGIAAAPEGGWGITHDGGNTWDMHGIPEPRDAFMKPVDVKSPLPKVALLHNVNRQVVQVLRRDANNAAVLFAPEQGDQAWVFTTDGGNTWLRSELFKGVTLTGMRATSDMYWFYGTDAQGAPVAMTTSDERIWNKNPAPPAPYSNCNRQGCRLPGGISQLDGPIIQLWHLPAEPADVASTVWAASKDSFCEISNSKLQCTLLKTTWAQPANVEALAQVDYRDLKASHWAPVELPGQTYDSSSPDTHEGVTLVHMIVGPDGRPASIQLVGAAWADLARNVVDELKTWRFEPAMVDGKPVAAETTIPYVFIADANGRTNPGAPVASHNASPTGCCR